MQVRIAFRFGWVRDEALHETVYDPKFYVSISKHAITFGIAHQNGEF